MSPPVRRSSSLPGPATEVLESLYQHRLLSTGQIRTLHLPEKSVRRTQELVAKLERAGLAAWVPGSRRLRLWWLTKRGTAAVETISARAEMRRRQVSWEQAVGPLRAHTLCVNDVGIAFVSAARVRGDDCGPLAWRHEFVCRASSGERRGGELVIADAMLTYTEQCSDGSLLTHRRFIELDRATIPVQSLAEKLARYGRVLHTWNAADRAATRQQEPAAQTPGVLIVFASTARADRASLQRRLRHTVALHRAGGSGPEAPVELVLLDELKQHGPFAQIFINPSRPDRYLDWLGNSREEG